MNPFVARLSIEIISLIFFILGCSFIIIGYNGSNGYTTNKKTNTIADNTKLNASYNHKQLIHTNHNQNSLHQANSAKESTNNVQKHKQTTNTKHQTNTDVNTYNADSNNYDMSKAIAASDSDYNPALEVTNSNDDYSDVFFGNDNYPITELRKAKNVNELENVNFTALPYHKVVHLMRD